MPGEVSDHSHSGSQLEDCILPDPGTRCVVYGPAAMASPGTVRHGDAQVPVRWLNQNLTISPLKLQLILPPWDTWQCSGTFSIVTTGGVLLAASGQRDTTKQPTMHRTDPHNK